MSISSSVVRSFVAAAVVTLLAFPLRADKFPGFRYVKVADVTGFLTAIVSDSRGVLYYSVRSGEIYRLEGSKSIQIAKLATANNGNEALLGIALRSDQELLAHHVLVDESGDVISSVDIASGAVHEVARFVCLAGEVCGNEHHGGNVTMAPDGSAYFGIGDFGVYAPAQQDGSPGGKIIRISPSDEVTHYAKGFRNPFGVAWSPELNALIVADNGPVAGDEINIVYENDNAGWPLVWGSGTAEGIINPVYVFPQTIAPTGILHLNGKGFLRRGYVVAGFVTKALYYVPDLSLKPFQVYPFISGEPGSMLNIAQQPDGTLWMATGSAIYRIAEPIAGDCDGDGQVSLLDITALAHEVGDGAGELAFVAQQGSYRGSWGCDVNLDGVIDARDQVSLVHLRETRKRPVRP